jgi:hypothetical protein
MTYDMHVARAIRWPFFAPLKIWIKRSKGVQFTLYSLLENEGGKEESLIFSHLWICPYSALERK